MKVRCGILGWLLWLAPVRADYLYTTDFTNAAQAVLAHRYVDARTTAERMLEQDPSSFEADAILGQVNLRGEEDLGLAQLHLERARRLLEERYPPPLDESGPVALHQQILRDLRQTAYLRENYERSLQVIDEYNSLYKPDLDSLRGWPLLKLGRFDEARAAVEKARQALSEDDPRQADLLDTLGQLAYERSNLAQAESQFLAASNMETDTADQPDPVYLTNLGEALRDQLRFEEAEATWLEATDWPHPGTYAEPRERLACLYAGAARWSEALEQLEQSLAWRADLWPQVAAHSRASHLTSVGEVLLGLGQSELAAAALRRALDEPNRQALSSGRTEVALAKRYALYAAALELEGARARESQSWLSGKAWWEAGRRALEARFVAAWARSQASVVLARGGLEGALKPYGPGAMECPWMLPELARVLGPGPLSLAMAVPATGPADESYRPYRALCLPDLAPPDLAPNEALARAALLARQGEWGQALRLDPLAARRQGLSIGISVPGSPELGRLLEGSPRFHPGDHLQILVGPDRSAVVRDAQGVDMVRTPPFPDLPALAAGLHQALFTPHLEGWSPARLSALTREPSPGRMASARLETLLESSP